MRGMKRTKREGGAMRSRLENVDPRDVSTRIDRSWQRADDLRREVTALGLPVTAGAIALEAMVTHIEDSLQDAEEALLDLPQTDVAIVLEELVTEIEESFQDAEAMLQLIRHIQSQ
jgi:hypothetical protein